MTLLAPSEETHDWVPYLRAPIPADLGYIRSTWLSSYRTSPYAGVVPNNLYDDVYSATIDQLILRGLQFVVVANPAAPELLIGWLAFEPGPTGSQLPASTPVVLFGFVKPTYRRLGVMSQLLASIGIRGSTSFFYVFRTACSKYFRGGKYRPEIGRRRALGKSPPRG